MSSPKLGLVTVLYNAPDVLPDFFASLACQDYKNFQLYVVDNSSQPEPLATAIRLAEQYGIATTFIDNKGDNVGVAAGNNQGARAAFSDVCDFIIFINNDLLFNDQCIFSRLIDVASSESADLLSPLILNYPEKNIWYAGGEIDCLRALAPHYDIDKPYIVGEHKRAKFTYAPTCFLVVSRAAWSVVGEMDERYFAYYDDTDFLFRSVNAGYLVELIPDCVIYHKVGSSTGGDISYFGMYHLTRNRIYFIRKNLTGLHRVSSILYSCITRVIKCALIARPLRAALVKGLFDGFRM